MRHYGAAAAMLLTGTIANNVYDRTATQVSASDAAWVTYSHPTVHFSFRHPPGLTVEARDLSSFNIGGLVAAVDFVNGAGSETVLRFMVSEPAGDRLAV